MKEEYTPKSKEWFTQRIGKKIYRDHIECQCFECTKNEDEGLTVIDKQHAEYLAMIYSNFGQEGTFMNYRDEK